MNAAVHAVAVTRVSGLAAAEGGYREALRSSSAPSRDAIVRVLAELTGRDAADWRMRIGQPLPWVVSMEPDAAGAERLVALLRRRGLGAVWCDASTARPWTPKGHATVVLHERELGFVEHSMVVAYDSIRVAVLATLEVETSTEEIERVSRRNDTRAGTQAPPISHYHREQARSRALFLVRGSDLPDVRLAQGSLRLPSATGEAIARGTTSLARFKSAVDAILARTPSAITDERLLTRRRGRSGFSASGGGSTRTSNVRETDLVAHLMGIAWMEDQIDPASGE